MSFDKREASENSSGIIGWIVGVAKDVAEKVADKNEERAKIRRRPLNDEQHERRIKIPLIPGTGPGTDDPQP